MTGCEGRKSAGIHALRPRASARQGMAWHAVLASESEPRVPEEVHGAEVLGVGRLVHEVLGGGHDVLGAGGAVALQVSEAGAARRRGLWGVKWGHGALGEVT